MLGISCVVLKRLSECLHNRQHCQLQRNSSSSKPEVSEQNNKNGNMCSQSVKIDPVNSLVATNLVTSSALDRDVSGKPMFEHTHSSARSSAKRRIKCPPELQEIYRTGKARMTEAKAAKKLKSKTSPALKPEPTAIPHRPSRAGPDAGTQTPSVKSKRSTHETAPPSRSTVQQDEARKDISARASKSTTRHPTAATNAPSSATSTPRSSYQQHIEKLEKHRVVLYSLKREYGRAKADYERSENTLQCLRRQDQYPLWFWRAQSTLAEISLGKTARKLRSTRILEREMVIKV